MVKLATASRFSYSTPTQIHTTDLGMQFLHTHTQKITTGTNYGTQLMLERQIPNLSDHRSPVMSISVSMY